MLHIRDVEGPKKTGSVETRLEAMEQQVFKCQGMVERGLNANHTMITEFTSNHKMDAIDIGKHLSRLYDRVDQLQGQIYDLQNQNSHEAITTKVTSSEPHVDISTTSSQKAILPCASARNSSTHNVATSCDELLSMPCCSNNEAYTSSSTCVDTNHVEEIKELKAQVTSLKKDLEKSHEGMSTPNNVLCGQKSPNEKYGLGFNSNKKNKSKSFKKKGQEQVKNSAKIICFKCKIEGHHVRSCSLKKKPQSHKQQGKRPQVHSHTQLQVEERPLPKKAEANTPHVEKSIGKKLKGRCCYLCREKGHFASSCTRGNLSKPIIIDDIYSLGKDKVGNVFAKFVGTQSGVKKSTIWVAKPIVTNLLGPKMVGDQQAQT
ncbi:40S ribosomal protein S5-1 [Hordeum vulgare]|nr:40S ribosomal protein S5-1 [Hordeum vulgare]